MPVLFRGILPAVAFVNFFMAVAKLIRFVRARGCSMRKPKVLVPLAAMTLESFSNLERGLYLSIDPIFSQLVLPSRCVAGGRARGRALARASPPPAD